MTTDVTNRQAAKGTLATNHAELRPVTVLAYSASGYGRGSFLELDPNQISESRSAWNQEINIRPLPRKSFDYWPAAARLISPTYWRRFL